MVDIDVANRIVSEQICLISVQNPHPTILVLTFFLLCIPRYTTPHHTTPRHTIPRHTTPHHTTPHYTTQLRDPSLDQPLGEVECTDMPTGKINHITTVQNHIYFKFYMAIISIAIYPIGCMYVILPFHLGIE